MIRGLRISGAAQTPALRAEEILANNLANLATSGFRQDRLAFHRELDAAEAGGAQADGVTLAPSVRSWLDLAEGTIQATGNPEDLALQGPGFFAVQGPDGELYTRSGELERAADGTVRHRSGYPILTDGGALTVPPGAEFVVAADGTIFVDGKPSARVKVVGLPDPAGVRHVGKGLLSSDAPGVPEPSTRVVQGALEAGNADPVNTMVEMMALLRAFEANERAIQAQDQSVGRLIQWASG